MRRDKETAFTTYIAVPMIIPITCLATGNGCIPGHPGIGVNVEGVDGARKKRCGLKYPHSHISTSVPIGLPVLIKATVAKPREDTHSLLHRKRQDS